jgi:hypothetical protein
MWQMVFVLLLSGLSAAHLEETHKYHLPHILPPDDGLQMGWKYVEMW